jgi:hypothetical protein
MTEETLLPPPDPLPAASITAPTPTRRDVVPWFYALGFLILAAAIFYLWQYPSTRSETTGEASALHELDQRLADIGARLDRLEERPSADLGKVIARVDALEQHSPPDVGKITARVDALERRPSPDLGKITARVDALDGRATDQAQLASRLDALSGKIGFLSGQDQTNIDATKEQISGLTTRLIALEANAGGLETITKRLGRLARLQEAFFALASGRPIGDLPNAPEVLARYSHDAPPTEADLRLRFPQAEQAALATNQFDERDQPFIGRVWEKAQGLITIRRGDKVMVGNPSEVILNRARTALDAGDILGAVTAVETLSGQPAQAMARWLADAKALVDARSALAQLAAQA